MEGDYTPMDTAEFRDLAKANPDCLLMPELENQRFYAYTAPLNSYLHHRVTHTDPEVRRMYPGAFSVTMVSDVELDKYRDKLVEAVRDGDIFIINAWFPSEDTRKAKAIYEEAARKGLRYTAGGAKAK